MYWFSTTFVWTPDPFDSVFTEPPRPLFRTHGVFWVSYSPHTNHKESKLPPRVKYLDNSLHPCCSHFGLCDWPNGGFSESTVGSLRLWSGKWFAGPEGSHESSCYLEGYHCTQTLWDLSLDRGQDTCFLLHLFLFSMLSTKPGRLGFPMRQWAFMFWILSFPLACSSAPNP